MKNQKNRRLLMYSEAAEMLNLTLDDIQWLVSTRQLHEIVIRGKKRLDQRDVDRLLTFYQRVQGRGKKHAARGNQIPGR